MTKRIVSLKKLMNGLVKNGDKGLTGRARGIRMREAIEKMLKEEKGGVRVVLDFSGVGPIDFSWADEVVATLVSRLWSGEYGEKYLLLKGLTPSQAENINVALERKRLAVLISGPEGWQVIGILNNYLARTLDQVMKRKVLTLRQYSEEEKIGMNTSGTRLLNLYKKRLVVRLEGPSKKKDDPHRGGQFIYRSLLS